MRGKNIISQFNSPSLSKEARVERNLTMTKTVVEVMNTPPLGFSWVSSYGTRTTKQTRGGTPKTMATCRPRECLWVELGGAEARRILNNFNQTSQTKLTHCDCLQCKALARVQGNSH